MSADNVARFRVAVAATLVVAVAIVAIVRLTSHSHRGGSPTAASASSGAAPTASIPGTTATAAPAGLTTTASSAGAGRGPTQEGSRSVAPFANGAPARLAVPTGAPLDPLPPPDAGWRPLSAVTGTGSGTYATFTVASSTTQVRFRSSANQFHVYVVDQVQGREATAGYADVDCSGSCADLQSLSVPQGRYHVEVDADGPWELSLEEYG